MTDAFGRLIIGVFGSTVAETYRDGVELLARAVHDAGAVVLSGAKPPRGGYGAQPDAVKDLVVHALAAVADSDLPLWIGVARHEEPREVVRHGRRGVIFTPGGGHLRNFIEAAMCDGAVVIEAATPGTASEALFALYFGRPVLWVTYQAADRHLTPAGLAGVVDGGIQPRGNASTLDRGVAEAYRWANDATVRVEMHALPSNQAEADDLVSALVAAVPQRPPGPVFDCLSDEIDWEAFLRDAKTLAGH